MRSGYIIREELSHVLGALMPANRLICEISAATGLRVGDVLALRTEQVEKGRRFAVREEKTGKVRRVYIPENLHRRALQMAGHRFVFEGRLDGKRHRTRQAVYKDLMRAAGLFRLREHISPHTCRKVWAVNAYRESGGDLKRVQKLLNHESEAVTMIYAMADRLAQRRESGEKKSNSGG